MSQGIASIKNVTVAVKLGSHPVSEEGEPDYEAPYLVPGEFSHQLTNLSSIQPDSIILRSFCWSANKFPGRGLILLWSNIINDFLCSWNDDSLQSNQIHLRIIPTAPIPNVLEFKLYDLDAGGKPRFITDTQGELTLHFEFITYQK